MAVRQDALNGAGPILVVGPPGVAIKGDKGDPGPPGPVGGRGLQGPAGAGAIAARTATATVPAWCAVIDDGAAGCRPADPTDPTHYGRVLGVTAGGGATGTVVSITKIGDLTGNAGPFAANKTLWIGAGGVLAEVPVDGDWRQSVGNSSAADRIVVTLDAPRRIRMGGPITPPPITDLVAALTPEIMSVALTAFRNALPALPADESQIPPSGGWFRNGPGLVYIAPTP